MIGIGIGILTAAIRKVITPDPVPTAQDATLTAQNDPPVDDPPA